MEFMVEKDGEKETWIYGGKISEMEPTERNVIAIVGPFTCPA